MHRLAASPRTRTSMAHLCELVVVCEPYLILLALPRALVPVIALALRLTRGKQLQITITIRVLTAVPLLLLAANGLQTQ